MPDQPLVSILTPTYNRAGLLPETLDSLLAQDYPRLEIIVLDDGSTDGTPELLEAYAARAGGRLRWSRHENMGQARTVNRGFSMVRGELIALINSDDPQPPGLFGPLVACLTDAPDVVVAYPDWEMIDEEGKYVQTLQSVDCSFADMVRWNVCLPGPGALVRRSLIDAVGGWNPALRHAPDYEWYLRAGLHGPFKRVPLPLARWRAHAGSISIASKGEAMAREIVAITESFFARTDLPPEIHAVRAEAFRNAYLIAGLNAAADLEGPGTRFSVEDRIQPIRVNVDLRRQSRSEKPEVMVPMLQQVAAQHLDTIRWLHAEVAARDRALAGSRALEPAMPASESHQASAPANWRQTLSALKHRCGF